MIISTFILVKFSSQKHAMLRLLVSALAVNYCIVHEYIYLRDNQVRYVL